MKRNEERDALRREDWSRVYADVPEAVRAGVLAGLARVRLREARRRRARRALLCAACVALAVGVGAYALGPRGRGSAPDRVASPPATRGLEDAVYGAKDDPCFHLTRDCPGRRGELVALKRATALEFEKVPCPVCGADGA